MLDEVERGFKIRPLEYWDGNWTLNEEISEIPYEFWKDFVIQMASARKKSSWKVAAAVAEMQPSKMFPLCNSAEVLPKPSIEEYFSSSNSGLNRANIVLCIRILKFIEQLVFARAKSVAGPLTFCLCLARIVEIFPSFRSVQNSLGLCLSYNLTEEYRFRLVSEVENACSSAWDTVQPLTEDSIPFCQFDNWAFLPLHAVKVDGKAMLKVNGSLVQGLFRSRKRCNSEALSSAVQKRRRLEWKGDAVLGIIETFTERCTSDEHNALVEQVFDIVYGLVATNSDQLADIGASLATGRVVRSDAQLSGKSYINFGTLLLCAFKTHAGAEVSEDLFEQYIVYVDVSTEPTPDILTVRYMLELVKSTIRPCTTGRPRFVVVSGDQHLYKMLVKLWLESWRDKGSLHH
ncbi:hypothetical protein BWQ96_02818 [Gracilariopsis chorda]|uniref:Uncharacterized protein n=1 Tax=Gracilariopsis chorda TaxID=448386 RepID=A0A2V3J0N3_9FLOR|nr:hypothetical protein BWQ96_02818 [Gracilariopsis chorda]|eukprot:PXF47487.1 hypothetical protein BWQ96_02818 [Gracilariopsis chorda]